MSSTMIRMILGRVVAATVDLVLPTMPINKVIVKRRQLEKDFMIGLMDEVMKLRASSNQ